MRKHAVTIILIVIAACLAVVVWRDRDRVSDGERARRDGSVFGAWRAEALSRVELALQGETIILEREIAKDSPWRLTSPRKEPADQAAVERLLIALEFAQEVRKATPGPELGLETPRVRGVLTMGPLVTRFALGGPSPRPEGSAYLAVDDGAPVVVQKDFAATLLQESDAYRDRTVVPYLSLDLARFEVKPKGAPGFVLEHIGGRSFRVVGPNVRASRDALDGVWGSLAEMRAEIFPKGRDPAALLGEPDVVILMTPKDGTKPGAELALGGSCPGHPSDVIVVRRRPSPLVACAPRTVLPGLRTRAEALADHGAFTFHADEIEELRIERVSAPDAGAAPRILEIARRGTGFHQREPVDRDLTPEDADGANDLVSALVSARAASVAMPAEGAKPVAARVRVTARSGERQQVLELDDAEGDFVRAKRVDDGAVLTFSKRDAGLFAPRITSLLARRVVRDARPVRRLALRCGVDQDVVDSGSGYALAAPAGYAIDAASVTQLVDALTRGKIDHWLADADDGSFGLDGAAAPCRIGLVLEGGASVTVKLGEVGPHGVYGSVSEGGHVFQAPASFRALASAILVSRASTRVLADEVASLRIETRDGARVLDPAPESAKDALGALSADGVSGLGPAPGWTATAFARLTVGLTADAGAKRRVIAIGPADAGVHPARVDGVAATFELSTKKVERVLAVGTDAGGADAGPARAADGGHR